MQYIRRNLVHDLFALNKTEMLAWDSWGLMSLLPDNGDYACLLEEHASATQRLHFILNGSFLRDVACPATADRDSWADVTLCLFLPAGINRIIFEAVSSDTGDALHIESLEVAPDWPALDHIFDRVPVDQDRDIVRDTQLVTVREQRESGFHDETSRREVMWPAPLAGGQGIGFAVRRREQRAAREGGRRRALQEGTTAARRGLIVPLPLRRSRADEAGPGVIRMHVVVVVVRHRQIPPMMTSLCAAAVAASCGARATEAGI